MIAYRVTHLGSGCTYIGITRFSVARRWAEHLRRSDKGCTHQSRAIRAHGAHAFAVEAVACARNWPDLQAVEIALVDQARNAPTSCYNLTPGGDGGPTMLGRKLTEEQLRNLSAAKRATWSGYSPERRAEIAAAVSVGKTGKPGHKRTTPHPLKGRGMPAQQREKLAAGNRIRAADPAHRQRVREGCIKSERVAAYHASRKGVSRPEHGAKVSRSNKERWANMTPDQRADTGRKIAAGIRAFHAAKQVTAALDRAAARVAKG